MGIPYYYKSIDWEALVREFPPPQEFAEGLFLWGRKELDDLQNRRFVQIVAYAWSNPFYRRKWEEHGIRKGDIRSLDDLTKLPMVAVEDFKEGIKARPPFGDHQGLTLADAVRTPIKIQASGGTTGMPRATLFTPWDWEMQAIHGARAIYAGRTAGGRDADPGHLLDREPRLVLLLGLHALGRGRPGDHRERERDGEPPPARDRPRVGHEHVGRVSRVPDASGVRRQRGGDRSPKAPDEVQHDLPRSRPRRHAAPDDGEHLALSRIRQLRHPRSRAGLLRVQGAKWPPHLRGHVRVEVADVDTDQIVPAGEKGNLVITSLPSGSRAETPAFGLTMTPELLVQSLLNAIGIAMVYVLVALALAILTVGLSGMLVERVVFRPFRAGAVPPFGSARRGRCALSAINQFLDLLGANNLIPGPTSTELAIYLGYVRAGWRGLVRAGVLFITPAMLIVLAFAWVYERYGSTPGAAWALYGVKAVILGIVAIALWGLLKTAIKDTMTGAVGVAALVLFLVGVNPIVVLL